MSEPTRSSTTARAGARVVVAVVALVVGSALVAGAALVPWPSHGIEPLSTVVTPVALPQQLVCPGALLKLGDSSGQDADTALAVSDPSPTFGPHDASDTRLTGPGTPHVISLDQSGTVAAAQAESKSANDFSGFAAASCTATASESWLVGGATTTGRTALVSLSNPTDVDASVDLEVTTEDGTVDAPGATGIVVPAGGQRVLSLAGLAPDAVSPVVHVRSTGGQIAASMQLSVSRGLLPSGIDTVTPTSVPAEHLVIPGLVIVDSDDHASNVQNRIAQSADASDLSTVLRLLVPGTANAHASITISPEHGDTAEGATLEADLVAGRVTDVSLDGLESGSYTVTVDTDQPVVAAARASVASSEKPSPNSTDLAWFAVPATIAVPTALAVPAGPGARIHVANDGDTAVTVDLASAGTLSVPAHGSASLGLRAGAHSMSASGPVSATVTFASTSQLAALTVQPRAADADPVTVWP
jgi:hypothetical protein